MSIYIETNTNFGLSTETNTPLVSAYKEAQFPGLPNRFIVNVETSQNDDNAPVVVSGYLELGLLATGDGTLRIPTRASTIKGNEQTQKLFDINNTVFGSNHTKDDFEKIGLNIGKKYGELSTNTNTISTNTNTNGNSPGIILSIRRIKYVNREPDRKMSFSPTTAELIKSAIDLATKVEETLGWKITPLSANNEVLM